MSISYNPNVTVQVPAVLPSKRNVTHQLPSHPTKLRPLSLKAAVFAVLPFEVIADCRIKG